MHSERKPLIAVFPSHDVQKRSVHIRENYVTALADAGGVPFLVPVGTLSKDLPQILSMADAFFFSGGGDVAPERYGEKMLPGCGTPDPDRDKLELSAFDFAWQSRRPILAVCRGIQLMNVALGGTLYQDLSIQISPERSIHQQKEAPTELTHRVTLNDDGPPLLRRIVTKDNIKTNSFHHQAIHVCAPPLAIAACAHDGVIEAVSARDEAAHPFVLGVQWHPEHTYETDENSRKLFCAFVAACSRGA